MGAVLAKFRKEKTTYEILENLEDEIKEIEEYSLSTQIQQKRYVGNFLLISIGLYIIGFLIFYFVFFPPTWMERITYSVPLLIFPMLIFFVKRLVAWFFQRKLNKNSSKLKLLRAKKKKLIEEVMDKETYKVAIEILNRFADKTNGLKPQGATPRPLEQKVVTPVKIAPQSVNLMATPMRRPVTNTVNKQWQSPMPTQQAMMASTQPMNAAGLQRLYAPSPEFAMARRTPFPIINQQTKGLFEKMVDYLVGDGPYYRFAMICRQCYGHNGMAFLSEYEFSSFRCAFCGTFNPPKKVRPVAPPLTISTPGKSVQTVKDSEGHSSSASGSEKSGECESESEGIVEAVRESTSESVEEQLLVEPNEDAPADVDKSEAADEVDNSKIEQADRSITEEDVPPEILEKEEEEKKND